MNPLSSVQKVFILLGSLMGASGVLIGAIGAHWLKDILNYWERSSFETGVRYQMYHALALLIVVVLQSIMPSKWLNWAGYLIIGGTVLFSGSLYLLSIRLPFNMPFLSVLGPVTPIGGIALFAGWALLGVAVLTSWKTR